MSVLTKASDLFACVAPGLAATERELARLCSTGAPAVDALFAHVTTYGGKRLRPALVHLCAGLAGRPTAEHASIGAIVEALHISSLLHDDVLDEADTRRRVATLNALHGNETPILLGDMLYARAFSLALMLSTMDTARELARVSEDVCRGEIEQSFIRFRADLDEQPYLNVIRDKTASLYRASCALGAHYAGGDSAQVEALSRFGHGLGMAFQIIDDCLDVIGDETIVGKSLGTDLETGKITLPVIRLARRLSVAERADLQRLLSEPVAGRRRDVLRETYDIDGIVEECHAEANAYVEGCVRELEAFDDCEEKRSLSRLCGFVLSREH